MEIMKYGFMGIWEYRNREICKYRSMKLGNMEIWIYGNMEI